MKIQTHRISVPVILEVGHGKLEHIGSYLQRAGIKKYVVFFGVGIRDMFESPITKGLASAPDLELLQSFEFEDNSLEAITSIAFSLPSKTEAIVGIGGGKVLDVAKYVAFLNDKPFISVPTSTAHDGFASSGCSLFINGHRSSVHARMPYGIIVDTGILKASPDKFIYSGIGDIISKITAVFDWQFEESQGYTQVDDFAVMIAKKSVNSIARIPFTSIKDDVFMKELVDSLTMSGIAMEIAGNSSPASGSEHLISHALDKITQKPQLHGIQVGIATYIMSKVQQHRAERVETFLTQTGFFDHVQTLGIPADLFDAAICMAPQIKPSRQTYIHVESNREMARRLLREDPLLLKVFKTP